MRFLRKIRKESFGLIAATLQGQVDLYDSVLLEHLDVPPEDLGSFLLRELEIDDDFHLRSPLIVFIELTKGCNLRCKHCYIDAGEPRHKELSFQELSKLLNELNEAEVFSIYLTGGEPFLRSDILNIVQYACQLGFDVCLLTNGTLLTEEVINHIPKRISLGVSIDGIKALKEIRGVNFDEIKEKLLILKAKLPFLSVLVTVQKPVLVELESLYNWFIEEEIAFVHNNCIPLGRVKQNQHLLLTPDDIEKDTFFHNADVLEKYRPKLVDEIPIIDSCFDLAYKLEFATGRCKGGRSIAYVASNGDVYPCSNCAAEELFLAGNVREKSFSTLWTESFKEMRAIKWEDFIDCDECEVTQLGLSCKFRCPPLSFSLHGCYYKCGATPFHKGSIISRSLDAQLCTSRKNRA